MTENRHTVTEIGGALLAHFVCLCSIPGYKSCLFNDSGIFLSRCALAAILDFKVKIFLKHHGHYSITNVVSLHMPLRPIWFISLCFVLFCLFFCFVLVLFVCLFVCLFVFLAFNRATYAFGYFYQQVTIANAVQALMFV